MLPIEEVEKLIADQVRFLDILLRETRQRNKLLNESLGPVYAKFIGLGTPYEECIHSLRQVRKELGTCLDIIRDRIRNEVRSSSPKRTPRKKSF